MEELSPIHIAAKDGDLVKLKYFWGQGSPIDACNNLKNCTPLHLAAKWGRYEIVKFLVKNKCDLNAKTIRGETPILLAARCRLNPPWAQGQRHFHQYIVQFLIDAGAEAKHCDRFQNTVLHYASEGGYLWVVRCILKQTGVDINAENCRGETPLLLAARKGHRFVFDSLLEFGGNLICEDKIKTSNILHYAMKCNWWDVVQKCIDVYPNLNIVNAVGRTPLMEACDKKNTVITNLLLKLGADCNMKSKHNQTAISLAIQSGIEVVDVFKLLIQHGAFLELCNYSTIHQSSFFKEHILNDSELCIQLVVNKFNNADLPAVLQLPGCAENLPTLENLKIVYNRNDKEHSQQAESIKEAVRDEIESKSFCDVTMVRPMMLKMLVVKSIINHHSTLKRSASAAHGHFSTKRNRII